jgi:CheY-like chemotaxis protein
MAAILVVEDNPDNQKLIGFVLRRGGHDVTMADDAEAARLAVAAARPDLILMDIQLPRIDGLTLAAEFKSTPDLADVPIVALTANVVSGAETRIRAVCDGYLAKPINVATLLDQIASYLR